MERHPVADGEGEETGGRTTEPDEDAAVSMDGTWRPEDAPEMLPARDEAGTLGPLGYATAVRNAAALDAAAAADHADRLIGIVRETDGDARAVAGEALDLIGRHSPTSLAVWTDDLVALATDADPGAAGVGFRALAHLADAAPEAAAAGADAAVDATTAADPRRRQPALRLVAAIAESAPERVAGADRGVAGAMAATAADVRSAGALCAGTLLAVAPGTFPRTASALVDRLDDDEPDVRAHVLIALVRFARAHPAQVPEKRAAIEALGAACDADLGLVEGASKDALTSLLEVVHGYSF